MRIVKALCCFFCMISGICNANMEVSPISVTGGKIQGAQEGNIKYWFGIPFAAPPVGNLRWKSPQPVLPWRGVKKTQSFSNACAQNTNWFRNPKSEDCLYLNIWAPSASKKLPVMVWIHGGGLYGGTAAQVGYDGTHLAEQGVIVVSINYRLGIFGFFSHPELSAESPNHVSGNQGIQDQIAALRWVQKNIAAFGGDPSNVTIFGNSAGSESVALLTATPLASGLIHRAIGQSGNDAVPMSVKEFVKYDRQVAEKKGVALAKSLDVNTLAELRSLSVEQLHSQPWLSRVMFDNYVVVDDLTNLYKAHRQNDVPLLVGWTADEGKDLAPEFVLTHDYHSASFNELSARFLGMTPDAKLSAAYPSENYEKSVESLYKLSNDWWGWRMWYWAGLQTKYAKSKSYVYYFAHNPAQASPCYYGCGIGHGVEIPFVFNNLDKDNRSWTQEDRLLAQQLSAVWVNFAKNGTPTTSAMKNWKAFDGSDESIFKIGSSSEIEQYGKLPNFSLFEQTL